MNAAEYDAIAARVEAATEGPWMVDGDNPTIVMKPDKPPSTWDGLLVARTRGFIGTGIDNLPEYADAEFIAHARTDIPALLAALRERDTTITQLQEALTVAREECRYADIDAKVNRDTADRAEAAVARVREVLERNEASTPDDWGLTYVYTSQLRAALDPEEPK